MSYRQTPNLLDVTPTGSYIRVTPAEFEVTMPKPANFWGLHGQKVRRSERTGNIRKG